MINEDTPLIFSRANGNPITISDIDAGLNPVRISLSVSNGTLQLGSINTLSSITGNGTGSVIAVGTLFNLNNALNELRFTPTPNFNGTANLTLTTSDLGNSGSGGTLRDTDVIAITINPINDAPVNTLPTAPQNVLQGSSLVFSGSNRISISDVDAINSAIEQITLSVSNGSLVISNASGLTTVAGNNTGNVSLQGTVSGLNSALNGLRFTPDAQAAIAGTVNLTIVSNDLGSFGAGGAQIDTDILAITVQPANPIQVNRQTTSDFTQDGQPDILWRNTVSGRNLVWAMNGTNLSGIVEVAGVPAGLGWDVVGIGDFTQDGQPDILWRNTVSGRNLVWAMNGTNLSGISEIPEVIPASGWKIAGVSDFTQDGNSDVLWRNSFSGQVVIWEMNRTTLSNLWSVGTVSPASGWGIV